MVSTGRDEPAAQFASADNGADVDDARDEQLAYAAPVSGAALFVPDGGVVAPPHEGSAPPIQPGTPVAPPVSPGRANATLVALGAAAFLVVTNEIAPLGLIKTMAVDLGRSEAQLGMTVTVFAIATMLATMPLALLTTRMIRRWVLVGTMAFWSLGALTAAMSTTYEGLLASRVLTGMGHALFWAVVTPAAAGMFPAARRGKSVARLLLGASGSGIIGLPAETFLAQRLGWHAPFWILAIAGMIVAIAIAILMPSFRTQQSTVPRGDVPNRPRFLKVMGVTVLSTWSMAMSWTFISTIATEVTGFADDTVPLLLLASGVTGVATTWLIARYVDRWPVKSVVLGQALMLLMWVGMSLGVHSKVALVAMIGLQGVAWSILVVVMVNWALRHTPWTSDIGNGTYATVFNLGNAIGSRLGAVILGVWGARWLPVSSFAVTAVALVLVLTVGGVTPRSRTVRVALATALPRKGHGEGSA